MLARELFGTDLVLPDFPVLKSIRGVGISDSADYSGRLAAKFDYRNTEYDREPRLDIAHPDEREFGTYDFIVCSEVLEHVVAPVETAFSNLFRLLAPDGVLLMTVPYKPSGTTEEHFGPMDDFALAKMAGQTVLVRRKPGGGYDVFDNLVFHGGSGSTLEMRVFSEQDLRAQTAGAGFSSLEVHCEDIPQFGVLHDETWSLPIAARKATLTMKPETIRAWAAQWANLSVELERRTSWAQDLQKQFDERTEWALSLDRELQATRARVSEAESQIERMRGTLWCRIGRKLGLLP
jgi:SAM-dependent methyltransferase